ncbi:rhodanese-like domain-containing protein [Anaeromicrobium sediminis]|uniref:Rhodanese domain-containing protein n=1 Tax=Anaeromicrobium sediminis TaxID=1478221 RepID=A0A267MAV2_9FIRM|nr:rhodanese-like domain-containing protein [Anaeromicrobium sediminis]PAB56714.1 hypothetical protein CCE28_20410 [Anaeromicrobium sediminis]
MLISNHDIENISVEEIKKAMENGSILLDIRAKEDYNDVHITNAINIPFQSLRCELNQLDKDKEILVICYIGESSKRATYLLRQLGFNAKNIHGGMNAWKQYEINIRER